MYTAHAVGAGGTTCSYRGVGVVSGMSWVLLCTKDWSMKFIRPPDLRSIDDPTCGSRDIVVAVIDDDLRAPDECDGPPWDVDTPDVCDEAGTGS